MSVDANMEIVNEIVEETRVQPDLPNLPENTPARIEMKTVATTDSNINSNIMITDSSTISLPPNDSLREVPNVKCEESNTSTDQDNCENKDYKFRPFNIDEIKRRKFDKKPKNKLFVGGLVKEASNDFIYKNFQQYGEIIDACIVYEKGSSQSRGFGYVTFINEKDAENAIKGADGKRINGKTLCVEYADDPVSRPPPRRRYRSRSPPPYPRDSYPPRPSYRDGDYDRDSCYRRDDYGRDRYEPDRYYRRDSYDPYYPPRDHYHPPPSGCSDYRRSPPPSRGSPSSYNYRFEDSIPTRSSRLSEVDNARLRVNRERLREDDRYDDARLARRSHVERSSGDRASEKSPVYQRFSDSSDDEDSRHKPVATKTKPRQVSAFPSAYLK